MLKFAKLRLVKESEKFIFKQTGNPDAIHPFAVPSDTGVFVELLVNSTPGQNLLAASEMVSYATFMNIWSKVTGHPSEAQEISVEEADKSALGGFAREIAESNATSAEFCWGERLVLPKDLDPNVKITSLRSYIKNEDY
ncbi:hypothetical protein B7463_g6531, partial [Scytalidium lignicola]